LLTELGTSDDLAAFESPESSLFLPDRNRQIITPSTAKPIDTNTVGRKLSTNTIPGSDMPTTCEPKNANMAVDTATPTACPIFRFVPKMLDVTARCSSVTEPIKADEFGELNEPTPIPTTIRLMTMNVVEVSVPNCENNNNPATIATIPKVVGHFEPILSDTQATEEVQVEELKSQTIPKWVKNNAEWWVDQQIGDEDFVAGIQYMVNNGIMYIPNTEPVNSSVTEIPDWIKTNAQWWVDNQISDDDFVQAMEWLVANGVLRIG